MKQVFNNREACHVWASGTQDTGRNSSGSLYFKGDCIYSYGSHFLAAQRYRVNGKEIVLINNYNYSQTTAQHLSDIYHATTHLDQFYVDDPADVEKSLLKSQDARLDDIVGNLSAIRPEKNLYTLLYYVEKHNELCSLFNRQDLAIDTDSDLFDWMHQYIEYRRQRNAELEATKNERNKAKRWRERCQAARDKWTVDIEDSQERIRANQSLRQALKAWLDGETTPRYNMKTPRHDLIRVKGSSVETTGGASVPLAHALRLLDLVDKGRVKQGDRVGHYTVSRLESGVLYIGCHKILVSQARHVLRQYKAARLEVVA